MAKNVGGIILLTFVLPFARADELMSFREEHERRWNTPPELTQESIKMSGDGNPQTRFLSLVPALATVSLNTGHNNAHSVSLGASLDGISLSGSNSYSHPTGYGIDGSPVSVSQSATISAGLSGISTAGSEAYSDSNNAKAESHSHSFGQASATSFGVVENGQAITGAASSVGASQSSAATGGNRGQSFSQSGTINVQYPYRPTWNNVGPNNGHNDERFGQPTVTISKSYDGIRPTLNIDAHDAARWEQNPTIRVYKWRSNPHRVLPRPSLSIGHQSSRDSWNDKNRESTGLQIGINSGSSSYGFSASESASQVNPRPLNFASSSATSQVYTSAESHAQSWGSASSGYVPESSSRDDHSKSTSTPGHRGGNSVAQVNAQASGNGHAQGIASSEEGSFVRFPEGGGAQSQTVPLQYVRGKGSGREQSDSDIFSDLSHTVGELFDII